MKKILRMKQDVISKIYLRRSDKMKACFHFVPLLRRRE